MAFAIEISEVGDAEYPLIQTLRETVFGELGHTSLAPIHESLAHRHDLHVLIAHLEGNPLGFATGYWYKPGIYYLNHLGVLSDYRRQGVGRQLVEQHEGFARSLGYRQMQFNTFNHFPGMLRLALRSGYRPMGVAQHSGSSWDLAIRFDKPLAAAAHPPVAAPASAIRFESGEIRIPAHEGDQLIAALDRGFRIAGMVHEPGLTTPLVVLQSVESASK